MRRNSTSAGELADRAHVITTNGKIHLGRMSLQCEDARSVLLHADSSEHYPAMVLKHFRQAAEFLIVCLLTIGHIKEQPANNQGQATLQPLPPSHKQHSAQHPPSITSLNRNSLTNRRNQSPAPPAALPAELQTTPESVQLQDSWVLGSNVPLESSTKYEFIPAMCASNPIE
ncbi:hypothetical protein STEG23_019470, partial [Scotinomys teguina]